MRKIIDQSRPFQAAKSDTVYRLVEIDGEHKIEKVTTSVSVVSDIPDEADAEQHFIEFVRGKRANVERSKKRIAVEDAFIRHHVLGHSWKKIADDIGQRSAATISKRVSDYVNDMATRYLRGSDISSLAEPLDISENQLHMILTAALERMRERYLYDYRHGDVMRNFRDDVAQVIRITNFLNDWESFEYVVVSPFQHQQPQIPAGKMILYSEDFYEITRKSGAIARVAVDALEGLTYHSWDTSALASALGLIGADPIVEVRDMFGKKSEYYTEALQV